MKKIKSFIITIIFLFGIFYSINFSFAAWLDSAQCSDGTTGCGYIADISLGESCAMSGSDIYGGNRILGGQECDTVGGQDFGGYYMIGTREPNSQTQIYSFQSLGMTMPWGWIYSKSSNVSRYFGGSSIPTGVFRGDGPYYNNKFFDPVRVSVSLTRADDSSEFSVGSNFVYWTGCYAPVTSVFDSSCPANTLVGPTSFIVHPGDSISFKVRNVLRPNNGYGTWGGGSVTATFDNLTVCYTQAYFDYSCGSPGCSGRPNYIPTAPGVCSPETQPKAKLNAYWKENNSQSITKTIIQGQSIQIPFIVENIGDIGSVINNIQCILSDTSLGSISNCPSSLNK